MANNFTRLGASVLSALLLAGMVSCAADNTAKTPNANNNVTTTAVTEGGHPRLQRPAGKGLGRQGIST